MALIGRFNSLQITKHTDFGLYLDDGAGEEILLPKRYIPRDQPCEPGDWLNVFVYLTTKARPTAPTPRRRVEAAGLPAPMMGGITGSGLSRAGGAPRVL